MRKLLWTSYILAASVAAACCWTATADAYSSRGTPEYTAEVEAAGKIPGGYRVRDANMRSTKKSISIATSNALGRQVNWECPVRAQVVNGQVRYYTGTPQVAN